MQESLFTITSPARHERHEEMSLTLNTAFVKTRAPSQGRDLAAELAQLSSTPACRAIFTATEALARQEGLTELEAAERLIETFRKLDALWGSYLHQEGLARLNSE